MFAFRVFMSWTRPSSSRSSRPMTDRMVRQFSSEYGSRQTHRSSLVSIGFLSGARILVQPRSPGSSTLVPSNRCSTRLKLIIVSTIGTSTHCPSPVRSRQTRAARTAWLIANELSLSAITDLVYAGSSPASVGIIAKPEAAWTMSSYAGSSARELRDE